MWFAVLSTFLRIPVAMYTTLAGTAISFSSLDFKLGMRVRPIEEVMPCIRSQGRLVAHCDLDLEVLHQKLL